MSRTPGGLCGYVKDPRGVMWLCQGPQGGYVVMSRTPGGLCGYVKDPRGVMLKINGSVTSKIFPIWGLHEFIIADSCVLLGNVVENLISFQSII